MPKRYWIAVPLYLALSAVFVHDWDGYVFERTTRDFWAGESPYDVAQRAPYYTFLNPDDEYPQWYAYPPLPLLGMSVTFTPAIYQDLPAYAERLLLKLPMTLGLVALAVVAGAWASHLGKDERTRGRVERLMLFNPFLIIIGPVWGMTDPGLMALFLFGLLRFEQGRTSEAGVFFALSSLVKLFPVFLALPLVAYYVHHRGWRPIARTLAVSATVWTAACLPFLLSNSGAFWEQILATHLRRQAQGLTIWLIEPFSTWDPDIVALLSLGLLATSLLVLGILAPHMRGPRTPLTLTFLAAAAVLLWNRVVNEQYLVLAVAPLLLLLGLGEFRGWAARIGVHAVPSTFAVLTMIQGFHLVTFFPPDIAGPLFGRPTDAVANDIRGWLEWGFRFDHDYVLYGALLALVGGLVLVLRDTVDLGELKNQSFLPRPLRRDGKTAMAFNACGCVALVLLGSLPLVSPAALGERQEFEAPDLPDRPLVGAFYYLWWNNPAHDPELDVPYGNWADGASQFPELGYYTQTRGVAREHVRMMRENGIDVAIVSFHSPEVARFRVFQEEALRGGLLVAPLIELNELYDQVQNKPHNETGHPVWHAAYRLTDATRHEFVDFVSRVEPVLRAPNAYKVDGRPVIYFYDSYVSAVGFHPDEQRALAGALLREYGIGELRAGFGNPALEPTITSLLRHYPTASNAWPADDLAAYYLQRFDAETVRGIFSTTLWCGSVAEPLAVEPITVDAVVAHYREARYPDLNENCNGHGGRKYVTETEAQDASFVPEVPLFHQPTPPDMKAFYFSPIDPETGHVFNATRAADGRLLHQNALWRSAHVRLHEDFWAQARAELEERLGPLFLVSGESFDQKAGFEAGTAKSLTNLDIFDGAFIYSPSFTWGVQPRDEMWENYEAIFDLWTYRNLWMTSFANARDRYSAFGIAPAYRDIEKRGDVTGFEIPARSPSGDFTYELSWESALQAPPSLVVVATFNEFFEGSGIEPSREYGDQFLNQTAYFRERLAAVPTPDYRIVVVAHERASRLNPFYSEMDNPHYWGLSLVANAARLFGGSSIEAIDSWAPDIRPREVLPDLVLVDGGRDDYPISAAVREQLSAWRNESIPIIVIGREVAPELRGLIPETCRAGSTPPLGLSVPGEEFQSTDPGNASHDDHLNLGPAPDVVYGTDDAPGRLFLDRAGKGDPIPIGARCNDPVPIAFVNVKPWLPVDQASRAREWVQPSCLEVVVATFFPELAPGAPPECVASYAADA